jgi:hypothetical protein
MFPKGRRAAADAQHLELHGGDPRVMGGRQNHTHSGVLVASITVPAVTDV